MRPLARTAATALMLALTLAGPAACVGSDAALTAPVAEIVGTYALRTGGGIALPAAVAVDGAARLEVTSATRTLAADGTYREQLDFRYVSATETITGSNDAHGTYRVQGKTVTFVDAADGAETTAECARGSLSLELYERTFEYRK
jgi:hypothetical protein